MNRFLIELDGFFVRKKIIVLPNRDPCQHKMKLFVTTVNSWKLLTSVACSLDPPLLNYDFQKTGEGCSNLFFLLVYVDGGRAFFQWNYRNWCRNPAPVWLDRENYNSALYLVTLSEENIVFEKMGNKRMHAEPPKVIICKKEECEYAVHFWNCTIKKCESLYFYLLLTVRT